VTPAGYAFSIWGIIFVLEGSGVAFLSWPADGGSVRAITARCVRSSWLVMWTCQNLWQIVFVQTPLNPPTPYASLNTIFVPCCFLLLSSWAAGLTACRRLAVAGFQSHAAGVLVALGSAINTGWLSAASCIGLALVGQGCVGGPDAFNDTGAPLALASAATGGALLALQQWGAGYLGLGYAGAVAWALCAVAVNTANPASTPQVRSSALAGTFACYSFYFSL